MLFFLKKDLIYINSWTRSEKEITMQLHNSALTLKAIFIPVTYYICSMMFRKGYLEKANTIITLVLIVMHFSPVQSFDRKET